MRPGYGALIFYLFTIRTIYLTKKFHATLQRERPGKCFSLNSFTFAWNLCWLVWAGRTSATVRCLKSICWLPSGFQTDALSILPKCLLALNNSVSKECTPRKSRRAPGAEVLAKSPEKSPAKSSAQQWVQPLCDRHGRHFDTCSPSQIALGFHLGNCEIAIVYAKISNSS